MSQRKARLQCLEERFVLKGFVPILHLEIIPQAEVQLRIERKIPCTTSSKLSKERCCIILPTARQASGTFCLKDSSTRWDPRAWHTSSSLCERRQQLGRTVNWVVVLVASDCIGGTWCRNRDLLLRLSARLQDMFSARAR
jgi:hypothetical protein